MAVESHAASTLAKLEERQMDPEVEMLMWSPVMDILAVALVNGDVALFRLNWQRIWTYSPPKSQSDPEAQRSSPPVQTRLSWRPDGKMLAAGSCSGVIVILDIESNEPIHRMDLGSKLTCLKWIASPENRNKPDNASSGDWNFLTRLPLLSKAYSTTTYESQFDVAECRIFDKDGPTSLLVCGTEQGFINMYINGFLHCARLDLNQLSHRPCVIQDVTLASDLSHISVLISDRSSPEESDLALVILSLPLISTCYQELLVLAEYYNIFQGTLNYLNQTLKQLSEAWEEIVLEMDTKLANLAKKLPDGGMSADFLELLLFGSPSAEIEHFLLHEMTDKGVKKLDSSIGVSYANVQKLVMQYLHFVIQTMSFHITNFLGKVRSNEKFALLGISTDELVDARSKLGSLWAKGTELQQVIIESRHNFRVFFKWIRREILRLSDDSIPDDLNQMSQMDVKFIADFLANFDLDENDSDQSSLDEGEETMDSDDSNKFTHKHLERVGQYLVDSPLVRPVDRSKCPWQEFLKKNPDILDIEFIIKVNEEASLVQEFKHAEKSILTMFQSMHFELTDQCQFHGLVGVSPWTDKSLCHQLECSDRVLGSMNDGQSNSKFLLFELSQSRDKRTRLRAFWIELPTHLILVDLQFYTGDILSVLLKENPPKVENAQWLVQFPVLQAEPYFKDLPVGSFQSLNLIRDFRAIQTKKFLDIADMSCHRELWDIAASSMAVSEPRKVAAMLFENRKRIRIYDMEVELEEDEDEDDTMGTSGLSADLNSSA
ncbi:hypothetical protein TCAL_16639 [Tigriopus californicus]|uniref:Anaphase-promoting complex subunit 4 n=1 Tax=Tigriopus californicus TaxID=6832 RepID=A0A553NB44_TIGCA|nr:anaphase-promoting complex subunit 4-like [Tigriopus californicus]TRY62653.1 hypothetical protein TCAL_16639 [Tigriopus californicus]